MGDEELEEGRWKVGGMAIGSGGDDFSEPEAAACDPGCGGAFVISHRVQKLRTVTSTRTFSQSSGNRLDP